MTRNRPWCPLTLTPTGEADLSQPLGICKDERSIAYENPNDPTDETVTGQYCSLPFMMNEKLVLIDFVAAFDPILLGYTRLAPVRRPFSASRRSSTGAPGVRTPTPAWR